MFRRKQPERTENPPGHDGTPSHGGGSATAPATPSMNLDDIPWPADLAEEEVQTRLVIGLPSIVKTIIWMMYQTKASIIIVMPRVIPELLEAIAGAAYERKGQKFFVTSYWDTSKYGEILKKMSVLGNIQFRALKGPGEYFAVSRDAREILITPDNVNAEKIVAIHSADLGFVKLYSQFIGPMFQANSMPLKS
nr:hypothetical protein [Candidatus Sigynarchaeota archaeon]